MTILKVHEADNTGHLVIDVRYNFVTYERQKWHRCTARTSGTCSHTDTYYPAGSVVYRPTGSPANRAQRVTPEALVQLGVTGLKATVTRRKPTYEKKKVEAIVAANTGTRRVTFPDDWKPNREGMRNTTRDLLGIKSSLG